MCRHPPLPPRSHAFQGSFNTKMCVRLGFVGGVVGRLAAAYHVHANLELSLVLAAADRLRHPSAVGGGRGGRRDASTFAQEQFASKRQSRERWTFSTPKQARSGPFWGRLRTASMGRRPTPQHSLPPAPLLHSDQAAITRPFPHSGTIPSIPSRSHHLGLSWLWPAEALTQSPRPVPCRWLARIRTRTRPSGELRTTLKMGPPSSRGVNETESVPILDEQG